MYCSKCGKEINDEAVICVHCGCAVENKMNTKANEADAPSTAWAVLGFFIPLVGLILYLLNKDKMPLKARSAGKGALIGFIVSIVFVIVYSIIAAALLSSVTSSLSRYL